jgi:hypothetical protein
VIGAPFTVGLPQGGELMGQRENHMIVLAGQQPCLGAFQPVMGQGALATRTTAVAARMELLFGVAILEADPFFVAERLRLTLHDRVRGTGLIGAQAMLLSIGLESRSEDALDGRFHGGVPICDES